MTTTPDTTTERQVCMLCHRDIAISRHGKLARHNNENGERCHGTGRYWRHFGEIDAAAEEQARNEKKAKAKERDDRRAATKTCPSVLRFTTDSPLRSLTRYIQCQKHDKHRTHFAAWGGAQAWRQADWRDGQDGVITLDEVPHGKRIW